MLNLQSSFSSHKGFSGLILLGVLGLAVAASGGYYFINNSTILNQSTVDLETKTTVPDVSSDPVSIFGWEKYVDEKSGLTLEYPANSKKTVFNKPGYDYTEFKNYTLEDVQKLGSYPKGHYTLQILMLDPKEPSYVKENCEDIVIEPQEIDYGNGKIALFGKGAKSEKSTQEVYLFCFKNSETYQTDFRIRITEGSDQISRQIVDSIKFTK